MCLQTGFVRESSSLLELKTSENGINSGSNYGSTLQANACKRKKKKIVGKVQVSLSDYQFVRRTYNLLATYQNVIRHKYTGFR